MNCGFAGQGASEFPCTLKELLRDFQRVTLSVEILVLGTHWSVFCWCCPFQVISFMVFSFVFFAWEQLAIARFLAIQPKEKADVWSEKVHQRLLGFRSLPLMEYLSINLAFFNILCNREKNTWFLHGKGGVFDNFLPEKLPFFGFEEARRERRALKLFNNQTAIIHFIIIQW